MANPSDSTDNATRNSVQKLLNHEKNGNANGVAAELKFLDKQKRKGLTNDAEIEQIKNDLKQQQTPAYTNGPENLIDPNLISTVPEAPVTYKADDATEYSRINQVAGNDKLDVYNDHASGRLQGIADATQTDQMKSKLDPYWNQNHAMDSRRGNLNGMSYGSTLNMSRMADRFNNRVWQKGGSIGHRDATHGSTAIDLGDWDHKAAPIETQEMRQMRANERLDERARGYDVDRQNRVLNYGIDMQQRADQTKMDLEQQAGISDIQLNTAIRNSMIENNMNLPAQTYYMECRQRFMTYLELHAKSEMFREAMRLYNQNPEIGAMWAQTFAGIGQAPSMTAMYNSSMYQQLAAKYGATQAQRMLQMEYRADAMFYTQMNEGMFNYTG